MSWDDLEPADTAAAEANVRAKRATLDRAIQTSKDTDRQAMSSGVPMRMSWDDLTPTQDATPQRMSWDDLTPVVPPATKATKATKGGKTAPPAKPPVDYGPSAVYKPAKFDPFSGKPTVHAAPAPTGPRPELEPVPRRGANVLAPAREGYHYQRVQDDELGRPVFVEAPDYLVPSERIKDRADLKARLDTYKQMRVDLLKRPEAERRDSLALLDQRIIPLQRIYDDTGKQEEALMRAGRTGDVAQLETDLDAIEYMHAPSMGGRTPDRPKNLPWYLKGYAADIGAGAQAGVVALGDVVLGVEKMFGVTPSRDFPGAIEEGHRLAEISAERGGKGIGHEVVRGLTELGVQLPALGAAGTPMLALIGAAQAAARPDASPEDVAKNAAMMATIGKVLHTSGGLNVPMRVLMGGATGAEIGRAHV